MTDEIATDEQKKQAADAALIQIAATVSQAAEMTGDARLKAIAATATNHIKSDDDLLMRLVSVAGHPTPPPTQQDRREDQRDEALARMRDLTNQQREQQRQWNDLTLQATRELLSELKARRNG